MSVRAQKARGRALWPWPSGASPGLCVGAAQCTDRQPKHKWRPGRLGVPLQRAAVAVRNPRLCSVPDVGLWGLRWFPGPGSPLSAAGSRRRATLLIQGTGAVPAGGPLPACSGRSQLRSRARRAGAVRLQKTGCGRRPQAGHLPKAELRGQRPRPAEPGLPGSRGRTLNRSASQHTSLLSSPFLQRK